jgi:hypothetical protein
MGLSRPVIGLRYLYLLLNSTPKVLHEVSYLPVIPTKSLLSALRDTRPVLLILELRIIIFEGKPVCCSAKHNGIDKGTLRQVNVADTRGHRLRRTAPIGHWHSGQSSSLIERSLP